MQNKKTLTLNSDVCMPLSPNLFIKGVFFALICAVSYAFNPIMMKLGYQVGLDAITILQGRFLSATICMTIFLLFYSRKDLKPTKRLLIKALIIAAGIMIPMNLLYAEALKYIPASLSTLITYMYPMVVIGVSALLMSQKICKENIISIIFIVIGSICIFSNAVNQKIDMYGLIICTVGMFFYAAYILVVQKFVKNESALSLTFYVIIFTMIIYMLTKNPIAIIELNPKQLGVCFIYGVVCTICTTVFLFYAISSIGAVKTSIFCSFEPAFTVVFAFLLLGEKMFPLRIAGLVLLTAGIVIPNINELFFKNKKTGWRVTK